MSKNTEIIPFTEIVERASELARERADVEGKVRAIVNDIYVRELPRKEDWSFFLVTSAITVQASYQVGNVTATTGGTSVTFSSDATIVSTFSRRKLKISGNSYVYDFTFSGTTSGTINPPLSGDQNALSAPYHLFQPVYTLASDFDRFPKNGGLINFEGGKEDIISESAYQDFTSNYESSPTDDPRMCRLIGTDTLGNTLLELNAPPKSAKSYKYDYLIRPKVMRETTAGLINSLASGGTSVSGNNQCLFTEATTGDWLRIDALGIKGDSLWFQIAAISNNSSLTLATAFALTGITSASYTICSAPAMPYKMHPVLLYGTILQLTADQDDPQMASYNLKLAECLSDGKRIYKTRIYNQDIHHYGEDWQYRR